MAVAEMRLIYPEWGLTVTMARLSMSGNLSYLQSQGGGIIFIRQWEELMSLLC